MTIACLTCIHVHAHSSKVDHLVLKRALREAAVKESLAIAVVGAASMALCAGSQLRACSVQQAMSSRSFAPVQPMRSRTMVRGRRLLARVAEVRLAASPTLRRSLAGPIAELRWSILH
jgi:hypothetical protein